MKQIINCFKHPLNRQLDIDLPEATVARARIIRQKFFLKQLYRDWYRELIDLLPDRIEGPVVELGSGGGFIQDIRPDIITSDILNIKTVDLIFNAQQLPFFSSSLRGLLMIDVFHHLPHIREFLTEAGRCVKTGGVIAMIEPWYTTWSGFIYRHFHNEPFLPKATDWGFPVRGPLSGANMALPWIVFGRDRHVFEKEYPEWEIKEIFLHTPFSYLLSGGVSIRSLLPGKTYALCRRIESMNLYRWMNSIAMFATIILVKN